MDIEQFRNLLDQHGGTLIHLPESDQVAITELLQNDEKALTLLEQQQEIDRLLDQAMLTPSPLGLEQRILAIARDRESSWVSIAWTNFIWKPVFASVLSLFTGIYIGTLSQDAYAVIEEDLASVAIYDVESWMNNDES